MSALHNLKIGDYVVDRAGQRHQVTAIYNKGTAAHQVLLVDEYYPILVSEMIKLGYLSTIQRPA